MRTIYRIIASFPNDIMIKLKKNIEYTDGGSHNIVLSKFQYDISKDCWTGVYAITDNKKFLKEWLSIHKKNFFNIVKTDFSKEYFLKYKKDASVHRLLLQKKKLCCGTNEKISVCMPMHEYDVIEDYIDNILSGYAADEYETTSFPPFNIFKKKYQRALEIFMYTNNYLSYLSLPFVETHLNLDTPGLNLDVREELLANIEIADDALSYGLSYPSGLSIRAEQNLFEAYIKCFNVILSA